MAIHCVRPNISGEFRNPFDCDELIVKALVTVSAFVALADGQLDAIVRDEAVNYIEPATRPDNLAGAYCRILRCPRARSRRQGFRRFDCRGAPTGGGLVADL